MVLTDAQWAKIKPHCRGKLTDPGRSGRNNRLFMEGVLWIARTGSPWRDLPSTFGNWSTAFRRFRDWREADVFKRIFDALSEEPDMEYAMVDATIVKVHRHGQGAKRMARPVGKWRFDDGLISLQKRIRPFGSLPLAKMEIRASWSS
ncbi:IS5 family transposase [Novosphingobium olei]|uniref:IS5 family transposase n=1 Tax=Novosphingobium olei TaxID=2728851 RepID=A0A7Y0BSX6_9SPHN|nr:IS5 family transposase [Novosphingobium olei]NML95695.1 IS5 family transposase [Novosphingobium olei]